MLNKRKLFLEVRKNQNGSHLLIEIFKYYFVIFAITYFSNWVYSFAVKRNIQPLVSIPGLWNYVMILLAVGAALYCVLWERMSLRQIGICTENRRKTIIDYFIGLGFGTIIISVIAGMLLLLRRLTVNSNMQNINWFVFSSIFFSYLFQGLGEEILFRGAFLLSVSRKNDPVLAILSTSIYFSLWHYHTNGYGILPFVNLFLFGVLCAVSVFAFNHVWFAGAFHAMWNFAQAHIFGVCVSGSKPNISSTILISQAQERDLISGGAYGFEGSAITPFVLLVAIIILLQFSVRRKN